MTSGLNTDEATVGTNAVFAHIVGNPRPGQHRTNCLFQQSPDALFERYMNSLIQRLPVSQGKRLFPAVGRIEN